MSKKKQKSKFKKVIEFITSVSVILKLVKLLVDLFSG